MRVKSMTGVLDGQIHSSRHNSVSHGEDSILSKLMVRNSSALRFYHPETCLVSF